MKKLYPLLALLVLVVTVWAQSPQKMSYQAVVRNNDNSLVINQPVGVKISILQGTDNGNTVYSELFNPNPETNANGLLTLEIGGGIPVSGTFSEIDWSKGPFFIRTEIDPSGGSNYTVTGTTSLLSVPFALHAHSVENDKVDDADNDPANEIQQLNLSGTTLSLSKGGGSVTLPTSVEDGLILPFEGNVSYANTAFSVSNTHESGIGIQGTGEINGIIGTGVNTGVRGQATGRFGVGVFGGSSYANEETYGVLGQTISPKGIGVSGISRSYGGSTYGVYGESYSNSGIGVYGLVNDTTGVTRGVYGESTSSNGTGVYGLATSTSGTTWGVYGASASGEGVGVYGMNLSKNGAAFGVKGESGSSSGRGVMGIVRNESGVAYGVYGESASAGGSGVIGIATHSNGFSNGIYGVSESLNGIGILGLATSTAGVTYGVSAAVLSPDGYSGFFSGGKFFADAPVGINTQSPVTTLHVRHGTLPQNAPAPVHGIRIHNSGANNNSWTLYTVNSNGNLQFYANNELRGTFSATNGTYTSSSNRRLKTDITALDEDILKRTLKLEPVSYRFISNPQSEPTIGFIAEDVQPLFPELVEVTGENGENLGVNYAAFSVVAIKAIQQQQKQMEALQTENEQLKKRLERLESLVASTAQKGND